MNSHCIVIQITGSIVFGLLVNTRSIVIGLLVNYS